MNTLELRDVITNKIIEKIRNEYDGNDMYLFHWPDDWGEYPRGINNTFNIFRVVNGRTYDVSINIYNNTICVLLLDTEGVEKESLGKWLKTTNKVVDLSDAEGLDKALAYIGASDDLKQSFINCRNLEATDSDWQVVENDKNLKNLVYTRYVALHRGHLSDRDKYLKILYQRSLLEI